MGIYNQTNDGGLNGNVMAFLLIFHGKIMGVSSHMASTKYCQQIPSGFFNIAMENGQFIDVFPINTSIYKGFSMAM